MLQGAEGGRDPGRLWTTSRKLVSSSFSRKLRSTFLEPSPVAGSGGAKLNKVWLLV